MKILDILGVPFAQITQGEALDLLENFLEEPRNHIIVTPNPEGVMQARRNPFFFDALRSADLSLADGTGVVLASRCAKRAVRTDDTCGMPHPSKDAGALHAPDMLPERVRGVDTTFALFERLNTKREFTAYFLGGKPGVAELAKSNMEARFPALKVTGLHHGYFSPADEPAILAEINALAPEILLVCTGMPRAEIWAAQNREINTRLTLCVGGTIDIMAGTVSPAPAFMRKIGMEWLWRLIRQPRRAARMLDIPRFVCAVLFGGR
ncbi:MAG: WecB/TagA/CpsF family glycosyltransferase [Defluviitaleaceae bacterium]|nr:WecB/TagA/CpsF family glycosyltransferase [Defluviitaleaceae bacterium]